MKEIQYPPRGIFYMYPQYDEDNELFGFTTEYEGEGAYGKSSTLIVNEDIESVRKEIVDKACEWLEENAGSYLLYPFCEYDKGSLIKDFVKAMKE